MEFQFEQLIKGSVYLLLFIVAIKAKHKAIKYVAVLLVLVLFFTNPIRTTSPTAKSVGFSVGGFDELPARVLNEEQTFDLFLEKETEKLNNLNKERENEISN